MIRKVKELSEEGLFTDGEHHKQWFLQEIARIVMTKEEFDQIRFEITNGVPP